MEPESQDVKYIKPNQETYRVRRRRPVPKVRQVPLWVLMPLVLLIVLGGCLIFNSLGTKTSGQTTYDVSGDIDYQVYLKENEYYTEKFLGPGRQYIASIINTIRADFDYTLDADTDINATYEYEILATAMATDRRNQDQVLYEQTDQLRHSTIQQVERGTIDIQDNVNIDYGKYNDYMRNFRSDFGISANCFLDLKLIVKVNGAIEAEDVLAMRIPLSDQTINIDISAEAINREDRVGTSTTELYVRDLPILLIGSTIALSSLIMSIVVIYLYVTRFGNNWYAEAEYKIFKQYDTRIVNVSENFIEPEDAVRVESFLELLDASDTEGAPIQYYNVDPGYKSYFVVKGLNTTYRYTLSREYQDKLRKSGQGKEF